MRCQAKYFHLLMCHQADGHEGVHYDSARDLWWMRGAEHTNQPDRSER